MAENLPRLLKIEEVAQALRVSVRTVVNWTERGILPHYRLGRRKYYKWSDIEQTLEKNKFFGPFDATFAVTRTWQMPTAAPNILRTTHGRGYYPRKPSRTRIGIAA